MYVLFKIHNSDTKTAPTEVFAHGSLFSVSHTVMEPRTVFTQREEGVPVVQSPADDPFHSLHAVGVDIMLQYHGHPVSKDTGDDVFAHLVNISLFAGYIIAVYYYLSVGNILQPVETAQKSRLAAA